MRWLCGAWLLLLTMRLWQIQGELRDLRERVALADTHSLAAGLGMAQSHRELAQEARRVASRLAQQIQTVDPRGPVMRRRTLWGWAQ